MLRIALALSLLSSAAFAQSSFVDLSRPQTDGFTSIVDLRGNPNLRPQDGNPIEQTDAETSVLAAQSAAHARSDVERPKTVQVRAYVRKDGTFVHSYRRAAPSYAGGFSRRR